LGSLGLGLGVGWFSTGLKVMNKDDASPVTVADRAAEAAMRDAIHAAFPTHGVYGEEAGLTYGAQAGAALPEDLEDLIETPVEC
jgi:fructose-1,6-bisphosphatase/inositol monophosphatase family enzyme